MLINNLKTGIYMTAATSTASGGEIDVKELTEVMGNSDVSGGEKTSFLIQYLLGQREPLLKFAQTLLLAFLVFLLGRRLVKILLKMTQKWMVRREVEVSVQKFIMSLAHFAYNLLLIFIVAGILGVGTSSIVAMIGSAGLAIGLALQGSLTNLAGGVLILMLKPFQVGDYIITSDAEGTVQSVDIFYTRLTTTDNKVIVIPNGTISNSDVTNTSRQEERMLILEFMTGYDTDISLVRSLLLEQMEAEERICQDKPMSVVVDKLNPGRIRMQAKAWVRTENYWDVRYRMLEIIKTTLQEHNITIG